MKKILFAMMACAGLCACSSDDIDLGTTSTSTSKVFTNDVAYMKINLSEVGTGSTRATGDFEAGSSTENNVANAHFYFYTSDGTYLTKGEIDPSFSAETEGTNVNIESSTTDNVVILEGLTGKEYPAYVATVLNKPADFDDSGYTVPLSMEALEAAKTGAYKDASDNFVMSTTSYVPEGYNSTKYPYVNVTPLDDTYFVSNTTALVNAPVLDIYVERLAAKVTLDFESDLQTAYNTEESGLVVGETLGNTENSDKATEGEDATKLYVKLLGWKLNATSDNAYMLKKIDPSTTTFSTWSWNDYSNYRSYWARGCSYGNIPDESTLKVEGLSYIHYSDNDWNAATSIITSAASDYCLENTTTPSVLNTIEGTPDNTGDKYSPALTGIVIKAQLLVDEDGTASAETLVRYKGLLYKLNDFYAAFGRLNGIYRSAAGADLTSSYLTFKQNADGTVNVVFRSYTMYDKNGDIITDIDAYVSENSVDLAATYYKDGDMYYIIPLEHLNTNHTQVSFDGVFNEGDYGVVRNHHYHVTVHDIKNVGKGVYDENAEIIPDRHGFPEETDLIVSSIKIVSWKDVDITTNL